MQDSSVRAIDPAPESACDPEIGELRSDQLSDQLSDPGNQVRADEAAGQTSKALCEPRQSVRRMGYFAGVFTAGLVFGWSVPAVIDTQQTTHDKNAPLTENQVATAGLQSKLALEQNSRIAAEASRGQLIAELASQTLALEKSERAAAELGAQLAAERARASSEKTAEASNGDSQARPPSSPAAVAPDPVAQQEATPEPNPIVRSDPGAETESAGQEPSPVNENARNAMSALSEGQKHFANGDLAAARRAFERAAELGLPEGALALGMTFDPVSLGKAGIKASGEPEQARRWYRRAHAMAGGRQQP